MAVPTLFWQSFIFESAAIESFGDVHSVVLAEMKKIGLTNSKINASDVSGSTSDTVVAVAFVQLGPHKFMAIVMAAGNQAIALNNDLLKNFGKVKFL